MSDQIDIDVQSDPAGSDQRDVSDDIVEVPNLHSLVSVDEDQTQVYLKWPDRLS